ncbi:hypothetical protein HGP14_09475 [Rhizobium sp. P32RR-XVIII]|uniref:DUF6197 family protein n=1 Tax=Rhizobium sp. P32RR-XVIII TaxID=2726738 RepID=UPI00145768C2|nr:hypothetical protein [Rhizobium sp. P32RR-XVIII]NLS03587.1 hypothetical protein [Rhizobium sp. P32RR-XVIII]
MSAADVLKDALAMISAPHKWAKGAIAFDRHGNQVKPLDEKACRFCMVGAIQRLQPNADDYGQAIMILRKACGSQSIFEFNDQCGHKAMTKVMRRAISYAEAA